MPELSVAVGSVHDTSCSVVPNGTVKLISLGQPLMVGGDVSCSATEITLIKI